MAELLRKNSVKVVGRLVSVDMKTGARKDTGAGYISGNAVVQATIGGAKKEYTINASAWTSTLYSQNLSQIICAY